MFAHEGHTMSDAWYFVSGHTDEVHMFYLTQPLEGGRPFVGRLGH